MKPTFRSKLQKLINSESMENGSDTPDFILSEYLQDCLDLFDRTVRAREKWYGREPQLVPSYEAPTAPAPAPGPEELADTKFRCATCGCDRPTRTSLAAF